MSSRGSSRLLQFLSQVLQLSSDFVPLTLGLGAPRPLGLQGLLQLLDASLGARSQHTPVAAALMEMKSSSILDLREPT